MESTILYLIPALGILGLVVMAFKSAWVSKQATGDENMVQLSGYIAEGAMAFLKAEWKILAIFAVIASALLAWSGTLVETSSPVIAISFIVGAVFSATAGYFGMNIATKANVRTTQAARTSLKGALQVAFTGGTVMGLGVAGLAVLGISSLFILFYNIYVVSTGGTANGVAMEKAIEVLAGFSLGAESIALFARVGGGIYTKAADVGADLVGKVEAGIPEDDVRNPATIADNVGDNVGDVAGMGADLFGSYVATILATMVLGREIVAADKFGGLSPMLLPMLIAGLGIIFSIIGCSLVRISDDKGNVQRALNIGNWTSIIITTIACYFVVMWMMPTNMSLRGHEFTNTGVFMAILVGSIVGALMSVVTEYYTAMGKRPVMSIVRQSDTGAATNIIGGLSVGMESTFIPTLILASGIYLSHYFAGLYGVAIAAAGMMATTAMQLAIDAFGPIADNAGGIAEMSELPKEVRARTDILDAVGNTTAATGKGFAIASAALTALALFAAFVGLAGISSIDIYKADVLAGLFVGGMIPFIFSSSGDRGGRPCGHGDGAGSETAVQRNSGDHGIQSETGIRQVRRYLYQGVAQRDDAAGRDRFDHSGYRRIYFWPGSSRRFAGRCYRFGRADGDVPKQCRRRLGQCKKVIRSGRRDQRRNGLQGKRSAQGERDRRHGRRSVQRYLGPVDEHSYQADEHRGPDHCSAYQCAQACT